MDGEPATDVPNVTGPPLYGDPNYDRLHPLSERDGEGFEPRAGEVTIESRDFRYDPPLADTPTRALGNLPSATGRIGVVR